MNIKAFVKDQYNKNRGGYSRILNIVCDNCNSQLFNYQKDGPGPLKRIYIDRIRDKKVVWKKNAKLTCKNCRRWLGIAGIYERENRKCFILFQDEVRKKVVKNL